MSVEQSMKTKTSKAATSENKAVIMFDHPGNISKEFDMQIAKLSFQFPHSLPIPPEINNPQ